MRILLTGGAGFLGTWLHQALGARHRVVSAPTNLFDAEGMALTLESEPWDAVVHLAGVSSTQAAEADPELAFRTNLSGTALLADLLARYRPQAHLVFPSTAHVYAPAPAGARHVVLDESQAIEPISLYGRTKWAAEVHLREVAGRRGQPVTILRLFNHTHVSQPPRAFLPHLFAHLREAGRGPLTLPVGNLELYRDFGGLRDLLAAFEAVLERPSGGVETYNVCSGVAVHLRELAEALAERLGVQVDFVTDPTRLRPGEPECVVGSSTRLTAATGWRPGVEGLDSLLDAFLDEDPLRELAR